MFTADPEENKKLCNWCTLCCNHLSFVIAIPDNKKKLEKIIRYLLHGAIVFIDNDDEWVAEVGIKCKALNEKWECSIYDTRPEICRDYWQDECEKHGEWEYYKILFRTVDEFKKYVEENSELKKFI